MPFTPAVVNLPDRKGSVSYADEEVAAIIDALDSTDKGEGVQIDEAQESEGRARTRTRAMKRAVEKAANGFSVREHVVEHDGEWLPVLSVKL